MKIERVKVQGCCKGVLNAIALAKKARQEHSGKITILGNLVHNRFVKQALEAINIDTVEKQGASRLELLDEIDEGVVIFTAHGVSSAVKEKAKAKGLQVIDASCPFVLITQKLVQQKIKEGFHILYIGKKNHPEAEAIYLDNPAVTLVEKESDIPFDLKEPVFVTNQTTMSILDLQQLFAAIKNRYPEAVFHDEICNATRVRQQAILDLKDQGFNALFVVGDPTSNNTRQLEKIGSLAGIKTIYRVETVFDLEGLDLSNIQKAAITSGASTPGYLVDQVVDYLSGKTVAPADPKQIL